MLNSYFYTRNNAYDGYRIFKKEVASHLSSFNLEYRSYADGDLGVLEQVIFDTQNIGGNFDFWESGWLGIYIYIRLYLGFRSLQQIT